jgi:hypothetical protein
VFPSCLLSFAGAFGRPLRIVELIDHAKSAHAARGCPTLLNGEEAAIGGSESAIDVTFRPVENLDQDQKSESTGSDTRHRWDILIVSNDTESCGGPQADTDCKTD